MKKTRFTETQIVKAIQEEASGRNANDICRDMGISRATFYNWSQPTFFQTLLLAQWIFCPRLKHSKLW